MFSDGPCHRWDGVVGRGALGHGHPRQAEFEPVYPCKEDTALTYTQYTHIKDTHVYT